MRAFDQIKFYTDLYTHYFKYHKITKPNKDKKDLTQIPKIIHYCWFGSGKFSPTIEKCIDSWKTVLPEYELILWNEKNFDIDEYPFAKNAYKINYMPFVSDVARLHALNKYGGIYLDTDVEVFKPLDNFLHHGAFSSYECDWLIQTALMGAKPQNDWINLFLSWYKHVDFCDYYGVLANTKIISKITALNYNLKLNGKQLNFGDDVHIYPADYFCPTDYDNLPDNAHCFHYAYRKSLIT